MKMTQRVKVPKIKNSIGFKMFSIMLALLVVYFLQSNSKPATIKYRYIINYQELGLVYKIRVGESGQIGVAVSEQIVCIKAPCEPRYIHTYRLNMNSEYEKLFNNLFKNNYSQEINLVRDAISDEDYEIFKKILNEDYVRKKHYSTETLNDSKYSTRGYYIEQDKDFTYIIISMGEKNTGGYSISVDDIDFGNEVTIKVVETKPKPFDNVTMAFTYPCVKVQLLYKPSKLKIINQNKEEFKLIKK